MDFTAAAAAAVTAGAGATGDAFAESWQMCAPEWVKPDIQQVKESAHVTNGGEGHSHNFRAIWADPKVSR